MANVSLIDGHLDNAEHCVCCGAVIPEGRQHCVICGKKAEKGNQRQIDRIRNMSVEELADFMNKCGWDFPPFCGCHKARECDDNCIKCAKQWLESEVTE